MVLQMIKSLILTFHQQITQSLGDLSWLRLEIACVASGDTNQSEDHLALTKDGENAQINNRLGRDERNNISRAERKMGTKLSRVNQSKKNDFLA